MGASFVPVSGGTGLRRRARGVGVGVGGKGFAPGGNQSGTSLPADVGSEGFAGIQSG